MSGENLYNIVISDLENEHRRMHERLARSLTITDVQERLIQIAFVEAFIQYLELLILRYKAMREK